MGIFIQELGEAPEQPAVDTTITDNSELENAITAFEVAYTHGTIAYILRKKDDENAPLFRLPEAVAWGSRVLGDMAESACSYAGKTYMYVNGQEGESIVEEAKGYAAERLGDIKEKARSFSQQDPATILELQQGFAQFCTDIQSAMPLTDSDASFVDFKSYIAEEYWDEELARMFRENVANKIPGVISIHFNISMFLGAQMQAFKELVETTWKSIYTAFQTAIDAYFLLAEESSPAKDMTYAQLIAVVGPAAKKAYEKISAAVDTAKEGATVLSTTSQAVSIGGSTSADLRESFLGALDGIINGAEEGFDLLKAEAVNLTASFESLQIHELALPSQDSVF